jgi:hypothetical protein
MSTGLQGHHRGTAQRRRVRLRPHACTGEGCHGGAISSCAANSGRRRLCATGCCVREKCGEGRGENGVGFRGSSCCRGFCSSEEDGQPSDPAKRPRSVRPLLTQAGMRFAGPGPGYGLGMGNGAFVAGPWAERDIRKAGSRGACYWAVAIRSARARREMGRGLFKRGADVNKLHSFSEVSFDVL